MSDSNELRTITKCAVQLETALKGLDTKLVHFLNQEGFITNDVRDKIRARASLLSEADKASELVQRITTRVELSNESYHVLLDWLKDHGILYAPIVTILCEEYEKGTRIEHSKQQHEDGPPQGVEDETDSGVLNGAATETPQYDEKTQEEQYRANMPKPGKAEDAVQLTEFCSEVEIILHTVNDNEYQAAITFMKPPMETLDRPVKYYHESDMVVFLGVFADKKTVLIQTKPGANCRVEMKDVLKAYPAARYVFAVGVCFGFDDKRVKLGDVLVSKKICDFAVSKDDKHGIFDRGDRSYVKPFLFNNFCKDLIHDPIFEVTNKRNSKVYGGLFISQSILINNIEKRDKVLAAEPEAIGGEMEGGIIMQLLIEEKYTEKGVIVIKGVADFADGNKGKAWQYTAAKAALHYTWSKLKQAPPRRSEVSSED